MSNSKLLSLIGLFLGLACWALALLFHGINVLVAAGWFTEAQGAEKRVFVLGMIVATAMTSVGLTLSAYVFPLGRVSARPTIEPCEQCRTPQSPTSGR